MSALGDIRNWFENILAFTKNGIVATTYADDSIVRGAAFSRSDVIDLPASGTVSFLFDATAFVDEYVYFVPPIYFKSSETEVNLIVYEDTDYAGGTIVPVYDRNRRSGNTISANLTVGATGTDKGTPIIKHAAFAASQGNVQNSASGGSVNPIILDSAKAYLIELENIEASATRVEYDVTVFETPASSTPIA